MLTINSYKDWLEWYNSLPKHFISPLSKNKVCYKFMNGLVIYTEDLKDRSFKCKINEDKNYE